MMSRVGQNTRNGQHLSLVSPLTRFDNNRNQFFNSYSVYKNCFDYRNNGFIGISERYRQAIIGYGFESNWIPRANTRPLTTAFDEWPTIEESFGTTLKPQTAQCWQWPKPLPPTELGVNSGPSIHVESPPKLLSTTFWDNINKMAELDNNNNTDLNNNVDNDWRNDTQSMAFPSNIKGFNNETKFGHKKVEPPIGTPLKRNFWSNGCKSSKHSLETIGTSVEESYIPPKNRGRQPLQMECVFCKNNNESPDFYRSHILKDMKSNILCPILRAYDCPICHNGGGPKAHTVRYCPLNKAGFQSKMKRIMKLNELIPNFVDLQNKRRLQPKAIG